MMYKVLIGKKNELFYGNIRTSKSTLRKLNSYFREGFMITEISNTNEVMITNFDTSDCKFLQILTGHHTEINPKFHHDFLYLLFKKVYNKEEIINVSVISENRHYTHIRYINNFFKIYKI